MSAQDGGAAFPRPYGFLPADEYGAGNACEYGMSLRDWFAGQALAGMGTWLPASVFPETHEEAFAMRARAAYQQADAMLAARGQP